MDDREKDQIIDRTEKENELKKLTEDNRRLEKRNKHIKKSKLWKMGSLIQRPFRAFFRVLKWKPTTKKQTINKLAKKNYYLQRQITSLTEKLEIHKEQLSVMSNETDGSVKEKIRKISKEPESIEMIFSIVDETKRTKENKQKILDAIINQYNITNDYEKKNLIFMKALEVYDIGEVPEKIIRHLEGEHVDNDNLISSFKTNLAFRSTMRKYHPYSYDQFMDTKANAYEFVDHLNIRRPATSPLTYTLNNLPFKGKTVIKPTDSAGGRGVYIIYSEEKIQRVKDSTIFKGYDELKLKMSDDLTEGLVKKDEWFFEELINETEENNPAKDLKFYCFYGQIGLVLEIVRFPRLQYCWWDNGGNRIRTGKYEDESFQGIGFTKQESETVLDLSSNIPVPFMRIDFLKTNDDFVFGEFTPKPGNYDEFNVETDRWLGQLYLNAEYRLVKDLLNGKEFNQFKEIYDKYEQIGNVAEEEQP